MKKKTTKSSKVNDSKYDINAVIGARKFNSSGSSVSDAVSKLEVLNCRGKCILTVTKDKVSKEKILTSTMAHRLFNSFGLTKQVALKNVDNLFQGL